jgi:hypothetical protein
MWLEWKEEKCIQNFGEETLGKCPFRRLKRGWENNIKICDNPSS